MSDDPYDDTRNEAAATLCPKCGAPYEVVRPGKIQPSCACDYIAQLSREVEELRASAAVVQKELAISRRLSEQYFDGGEADSLIFDAVELVWPNMVNNTSGDRYDNSMEVYFSDSVDSTYVASLSDLEKLAPLGFTRFFLNYADDTMQVGNVSPCHPGISQRVKATLPRTEYASWDKLRVARKERDTALASNEANKPHIDVYENLVDIRLHSPSKAQLTEVIIALQQHRDRLP